MATAEQTARRTRRRYYGWFIVAAGLGMQALQAMLLNSAFGAYFVLLQADFGWSRTVFSGAFSLQQVESGLLGPFQGWLIDRFGPRAVMRVGVVLFGVGFMLLSRIDSIATFYLAFVLTAVGASLSGFLSITTTLVHWFVRRRATAMGIVSSGQSVGGLLVPLVAWSLTAHGWRTTAFASGVVILVMGLVLTQVMRHKPEQYGYFPDGDDPDDPRSATARGATGRQGADFTAAEALRTPAFWLVSFGHASALLVVSAVMVHLVPYLKESLGYSVTQGAAIVALLTVVSLVGQVSGGFLGDRISKRLIVIVCMIGHLVALLLLAYATALWMVVLFAILQGAAWGFRGPLMQAIRADYFGRKAFGTILGFSALIWMLGMIGGPMVAGILADRSGSYQGAFTVLALMAGVGTIFWLLARPPKPPRRARALPRAE